MATDTTAHTAEESTAKTFLGHPRGLVILFFAEMWERFSYYGMRALLVTYLIWHFARSQDQAYGVYAAYAGMIYLLPLLGGYLADKYLGSRKSVTYGAILITLGHFCMAYEGTPAKETLTVGSQVYEITRQKNPDGNVPQFIRSIVVNGTEKRLDRLGPVDADDLDGPYAATYTENGESRTLEGTLTRSRDGMAENIMFLALALIIVGTGFLKANISTVVGALYGEHDRRRDAGFTIFYIGINIGAFFGILLVGTIGIAYGWAYGFGLAGIGMVLGLITFLAGQHWLEGRGDPPNPEHLRQKVFILNREWMIYLGGIAAVGLSWLTVKYLGQYEIIGYTVFELTILSVFIAAFAGVFFYSVSSLAREERDRMIVLLILTFSSVVFWTLFDQAPVSLVVFQQQFVDTGFLTPQSTGSFNPLYILIFGLGFTALWTYLGDGPWAPAAPLKFAYGLMQIGIGFLVINLGIYLDGGDMSLGLVWIMLMYILHTTGELCLSPVGLSAVTKLSVKQLVGFMMGMWFIAIAIAQVAAGLVSKATTVPEGSDPAVALAQFNAVYFWLGMSSIAAGLLLAVFSPVLRKMMHGRL